MASLPDYRVLNATDVYAYDAKSQHISKCLRPIELGLNRNMWKKYNEKADNYATKVTY